MLQMLLALALTTLFAYLCFNPYRLRLLLGGQTGLLFQRINRSDPERLFITVYNSYSTATMTNGQAVIWDFATDHDGVSVTRPTARATNAGMAAAGIICESILAGAYGLMQVYGYHSAVRMRTVTGGSPAIVAGRPLIINVAGSVFCLESVSTASKQIVSYPIGFSLSATSGFTTQASAAFIRAM